MKTRPWIGLAAVLLLVTSGATAPAAPFEVVTPETVGLSSERLGRLDRAMQEEVDSGRRAGMVALIARNGQIAHLKAYGMADREKGTKLRTDHYFRLYSMTKPVVSVALLMLYEEGRFQLSDPLEKYIPAFRGVKVYRGTDAGGKMVLEDPKRKIVMQDVLRHTAGFVYGIFDDTPVDQAYRSAGIDFARLGSLDELVQKVAKQPLLYHPGERWVYSVAHDVQARLVELFSGMPLDQYLKTRIFEPLGMKDTVFGVPPDLAGRYAKLYGPRPDGTGLAAVGKPLAGDYARFTTIAFGGLGLSSTITDYLSFAQMLLNGGELNGVRLLGRKTVDLMTSDNLEPGTPGVSRGLRYGLGVGVLQSPAEAGVVGSKGAYGWSGIASTYVTVDPEEEMVLLLFSQYLPFDTVDVSRFHVLAYQALADE